MKTGINRTFQIGVNNDKIELVFCEDDGTRDKHMIVFYNGIPIATIPLINESGFLHFIDAMSRTYRDFGYDKEKLIAIVEQKTI